MAWAIKRTIRHLEKVMRKGNVRMVLIAEPNRNRPRFHLHGVADSDPTLMDSNRPKPILREAFLKGCGTWNKGARQFQFKLDKDVHYGWLGYLLKDGTLAREALHVRRPHHGREGAPRPRRRQAQGP